MPVDVEPFSISGGGVSEPKAGWTASAQRFMTDEIRAKKAALKLESVEMTEQGAGQASAPTALVASRVSRSARIR